MSHASTAQQKHLTFRCEASRVSAEESTLRAFRAFGSAPLRGQVGSVASAAVTLGANFSGVALQANQSLKRTVVAPVARFARLGIVPRRLAPIR